MPRREAGSDDSDSRGRTFIGFCYRHAIMQPPPAHREHAGSNALNHDLLILAVTEDHLRECLSSRPDGGHTGHVRETCRVFDAVTGIACSVVDTVIFVTRFVYDQVFS